MKFETFKSTEDAQSFSQDQVATFLHSHLEEYGDPKEDIMKAIDYAFQKGGKPGGHVTIGIENNEIVGTVVINRTGMEGYIPENILVYIAVHHNQRGKGMGRKLMEEAIAHCQGNIALHVEPENPAKFLYEKLGFTNKYLEMRLNR